MEQWILTVKQWILTMEWTMKFQDLENGTQERIDMRRKVVGIAGIEAEVDLTQR